MIHLLKINKNALLLTTLLVSQSASADLYDVMIAPLIAKCPTFISGAADIRINATGYSNWESGRHAMFAECYETTLLGESVIASGGEKHGGGSNPTTDSATVDGGGLECSGSKISVDARTLGESVPITGTSFSLDYNTANSASLKAAYTVRIPTFDSNSNVTGFEIVGVYADGRTLSATSSNIANRREVFTWDGKDSLGNYIPGTTKLDFQVILTAHGKEIPVTYSAPIGGYKAEMAGFGGWQPSIFHFYDTAAGRLYKGDGTSELVQATTIGGGNLRVADVDGEAIYIFSSEGYHLYTKSILTGANLFVFNYTSSLLTSIEEPYGKTTTFARSGGLVTSITSPYGQVTTLSYDGNDRLVSIVAPDSSITSMTYHTSGLLATFQKPGGQVSSFTYDANGLLTRDAHSSGFFSELSASIDPGGHNDKITTLTTPLNRKTETRTFNSLSTSKEYSRFQRLSSGEESYSRMSPYYSSVSYPTYRTSTEKRLDPRFGGADVRYVSRETLAIGNKSMETLIRKTADLADPGDPFSFTELVTRRSVNNKEAVSIFNGDDKSYAFTSPEGRKSQTKINDYEQIVEMKVASLLPTSFSYNENGEIEIVGQGTRTARFSYDSNGYVKTAKMPNGMTTGYVHDALGRMTKRILHDGRVEKYGYDANGNLTSVTPPGRPSHSFIINAFEAVQKYLPPALGGVVETSYSYNADKQLVQTTLPDGRIIRYNYGIGDSRLESIYTPDGIYYYTYNAPYFDRPSVIISPDGVRSEYLFEGPFISYEKQIPAGRSDVVSTLNYKFDDEFRLKQLLFSDKFDNRVPVIYRYDQDNLLTRVGSLSIERGDYGQVRKTSLGDFSVRYGYDSEYGDLNVIRVTKKSEKKFEIQYERDSLGRISAETENEGQAYSFHYDSTGRYIGKKEKGSSTWLSNYTYDSNGNRVRGFDGAKKFTATYDAQDRLIQWNGASYAYSQNGDLNTKTVGSEVSTYHYDVFGNLKSVEIKSPGKKTKAISYEADGKNRRVSRYSDGSKVRYVYDGQLRIVAQLSENGQLDKFFVYGTGHSPEYMRSAGKDYLLIKDTRGSIRQVVDVASGEVKQSLRYSEWGEVLEDTNPGFQPFGYAGGVYDRETGLVRFGARDYDPEVGRWTSKDPILFKGGDANFYGYVLQDPVNLIDPEGTTWRDVSFRNLLGGGLLFTFGSAAVVTAPANPLGAIGAVIGGAAAVSGVSMIINEYNNFRKDAGDYSTNQVPNSPVFSPSANAIKCP